MSALGGGGVNSRGGVCSGGSLLQGMSAPGDLGGRQGRPRGSKFFHFHAVFSKNLKNNSNFASWRTPLGKILDPSLLAHGTCNCIDGECSEKGNMNYEFHQTAIHFLRLVSYFEYLKKIQTQFLGKGPAF